MKKKGAISVGVILAVYIILSFSGTIAMMQIPRLPLDTSPASVGLVYADVSFASRDDKVVLRGWYICSRGDFVIIVIHGGYQNRIDYNVDTLGLAQGLVKTGYDLFLFDLRGRGESEGKGVALTNIESDIGGAVDYLKDRGYSTQDIGIIGFCSGAIAACIFASQEDVGALVLDGCPATVENMVVRQAALRGIPSPLLKCFIPGLTLMARMTYGYKMVNPIDVMPYITCPILFIHEESDNLISLKETYELFKAANNPSSELWEVRCAEHSQAYKTHPSEYVEKLHSFFARRRE